MIAGKSGEQHQNVSSRRATVVRNAIGGRVTLDELLLTIRGYTYSSMETSLDETEALAREIERTIQTLRSPLIYSAKVLTLHTDEGLYAPYGICDVQCSIEWINEQ
jgi:flagellar biosynthesis/type III secretory pathway M-ring protein FliF/YscJ